jgi:sterol desaturase/sphingolipid hydroxylase (fatty acid hydroxylase superfamily)
MTRRPPRFALALLEQLVPGSAPIAGDLIEEYERQPSRGRVWREVLAAIAIAWFERTDEIRPLRLVDLQPADAIERTRRIGRHLTSVNLTASPLDGIGGLGLAVLVLLMTVVVPAAWWLVAVAIFAGTVLGIVMIAAHPRSHG